ncbi:TldD/PmbA family protein [Methanosalsum natronophilum]|uniref:TldD/PmbA family protein n=1 Tax=Methanosalsum natronophilum TaxID=768733 RepID=UPI002168DA8A|nr:TldD/PmbA family protein [Methanosalsum natronophilum]MCS3923270.1 PmbA protein [Methanosalsum natronophilum]
MYELGEAALKLATSEGAEEAEVYVQTNYSTSSDVRNNKIESAKEQKVEGIGIRAIINGSVGFASTNISSKVEEAVRRAVSSARVRENDPDWQALPSNSKYPKVRGIMDENIKFMELETSLELTNQMIKSVDELDGVDVTSGSFSRSYGKKLIMNTNGVNVFEEETLVSGFVDTIARASNPSHISTAYDFQISRNLDIDIHNIGKNAAQLALKSQNGESITSQKTDIILHPFAITDLLESSFVPSLNSDNVQKGRSSLKGKIGEKIGSEELSIIDSGLLDNGINTSICDDEGSASKETKIIENGIFNSYLYDSYTAGKDSTESTSNSTRSSYNMIPNIAPRNFILKYPQSNVVEETADGIYITSLIGAHTANSISGDFSVEARNAFTIKNGEISKPIKSVMISGNIFELLHKISGAGFDVRLVGGTVTPSIKLTDMKVIGS